MRFSQWLRRGPDPPLFGALLLAIGTIVLASWVSATVFDRLPHVEDEIAFAFQARTIAGGQIVADPPSQPDFFRVPFVIIRDDMWFGKYPPGYPLVLALGVLVGAPWLVNPVLGGLAVLLVFVAGRRLYDAQTGLIAAALLAVSPFLLLQAGSQMSHVAALVWTLLALLAFEAIVRRGATWPAVGCGAALGMLALTRSLTAVGIGLPIGIWLLAIVIRDRRNLRLLGLVAAGALPFVVMLLGYNALTTGSPFRTGYELWWEWDRIGFGEGISRDRNYTLYEAYDNFKSNLRQLSMYLYGWPGRLSLLPAIAAAALAIRRAVRWWHDPLRRPRRFERMENNWDLFLVATVVSLMLVHIAYWTDGLMYGPRYYFEIIGALVLLSARAFVAFAGFLSERIWRVGISRSRPTARALAFGAILVVVMLLSLHSARNFTQARFDEFHHWYGINRDNLEVVQNADISNAIVFVHTETWSDYAPLFLESAPSLDGPIIYALDRGPGANRRLLAEFPGREGYLLRDGALRRVGFGIRDSGLGGLGRASDD